MGIKEDITKVYIGYYDRAPDPAGLDYWIGQATKAVDPMSLSQIAASFAVQPESIAKYPYLDNPLVASATVFVTTIYTNLFNRAPDAAGLAHWVAELAAGKAVGQMIIDIMSGATDSAAGQDLSTLNNKVAVGVDFAADLAEVAGLDYENNASAKAAAAAALAGVTDVATTIDTAKAATDAFVAAGAGAGTSTTLTTGVDTVVGGSGADTILGSDTTLTGLDNIDGGDGVDTLKLADVAGGAVNLAVATITNVEKLELSSTTGLNANALDTTGLTGLTSATVSMASAALATVTASATTDVTITNSTAQGVTVVGGGANLSVTNGAGAIIAGAGAVANGIVTATTSGGTTVAITDRSGAAAAVGSTMTTANVTGNAGAATLTGNGLVNVNLASSAAAATIVNTTAAHALNLGINAVTGGALITDTVATTVNLKATGATATTASDVNLDVDLATTLNVDTAAALTLTTTALAADDVLVTANVAGAGSFMADLSGISSLTAVNASTSTGANTVTLDGTTSTYTGGSGVDSVTLAVTATKAVDGGAGTEDVLTLNGAFGVAQVGTMATNFEVLGLGAAATGTYDADGFGKLTHGALTGAVVYTNVSADPTLTITATTGQAATVSLKSDVGTSDKLNVTITGAAGINANTLTAANIETVAITTDDTAATPTNIQHTLTLAATSAPVVTVSGDAGLALTNASTTLTSVDASGITAGNFSFTTGIVTTALTIKGGAGDDTIDASAATGAVVIDGGNGANALTGSATATNTITGGTGNDTIVGGAGVDTIVTGDGVNSVSSGAGLDMITVGAGVDTIVNTLNANGNTYSSVTGMAAGDKIDFLAGGGANAFVTTGITLAPTAAFADFLEAATAGGADRVSWFQYSGDTYLVQDVSAAATFTNGADQVVKLVGLVDLSTATIDGGVTNVLTLG